MNINNEKELNRYSIAVRDLERVVQFINESEKHPTNSVTYESLLICAVVYYFRPFTKNEMNDEAEAAIRINIKSFNSLTEEEISLHNKCKEIRNKALAHAEWTNYPTKMCPETKVISSRTYSILTERINWAELRKLAEKICNQCHHRRADFTREKQL